MQFEHSSNSLISYFVSIRKNTIPLCAIKLNEYLIIVFIIQQEDYIAF